MDEQARLAELLRQGITAAKAGRNEEAREALLQVVKVDEQNEQAWLWLSGVVDSLEEKRICLENVLTVNPGNASARAGLDWLRRTAPPPPAAPEERCPRCGNGVSSSAATCPSCGLPLIVACPQCDEYVPIEQGACPQCGQALGDFRQGAVYHLGIARAYLQRHKSDRAQEAASRARAEAGDDPRLWAQLGGLYEEAGLTGRALPVYERAAELSPRDPALHARLGSLYRQHGEMAKAGAAFARAAELGYDDPTMIYDLASLELQSGGSPQRAASLLEPIVKKSPGEARAHLLLGEALVQMGDRQGGMKHYQRVLQLVPAQSDMGLEAQRQMMQHQTALSARKGESQVEPTFTRRAAPRHRPGCVTLYAILLILSAVLSMLAMLGMVALFSAGQEELRQAFVDRGLGLVVDVDTILPYLWFGVGIAFLFEVLYLAIGIGLWLLKNWARIAIIVLSLFGLVASLVQAGISITAWREASASAGLSSVPIPLLCGFLFGLVLEAYIIFWFVANRQVFD